MIAGHDGAQIRGQIITQRTALRHLRQLICRIETVHPQHPFHDLSPAAHTQPPVFIARHGNHIAVNGSGAGPVQLQLTLQHVMTFWQGREIEVVIAQGALDLVGIGPAKQKGRTMGAQDLWRNTIGAAHQAAQEVDGFRLGLFGHTAPSLLCAGPPDPALIAARFGI